MTNRNGLWRRVGVVVGTIILIVSFAALFTPGFTVSPPVESEGEGCKSNATNGANAATDGHPDPWFREVHNQGHSYYVASFNKTINRLKLVFRL